MFRVFLFRFVILSGISTIICSTFDCHDDPAFEPQEGLLTELQFNWLGALQYIHVKDGTPHYFRVPRVLLVTRQFVLSTAKDAAQVPNGYALGNVVFGAYERDEAECQVNIDQLSRGTPCDPAVLLMPIADVLLHPEYKHFGIKSSVALLRLLAQVRSKYMLPACLPYKNFLLRNGQDIVGSLIYVDFVSEVPRDFIEEEKEVIYLEKLHKDRCFVHDNGNNATRLPENRYICTTGCGLQSGAPTLVHEHTGHWNVLALAEGGTPCPDPLRSRGPSPPSRHILLQPYVPWITTAISGKPVGAFSKDDPFGYIMPRATANEKRAFGWVGHWWVGGIRCFDRGNAADDIYRFYHEIFEIYPEGKPTHFTYYLEIHAAYSFYIVCVKIGMPYQFQNPMMWGLNTYVVKLRIPLITFNSFYRIVVEAWCNNGTEVVDEEYEDAGSKDESIEYTDSSGSSAEYIYDAPETRGWYKGQQYKTRGKAKWKDYMDKSKHEKDKKKDEDDLTPPDAGVEPMD